MSKTITDSLRETLTTIVTSIIDDEDNLEIQEEEGESGVSFEVKVGPEDVGKIIGKGGRIANSIRTVMKAAGAKLSIKVMVSVYNKPIGS
jgi:hypothetical protein